jgi:hypothetical protein
MFRLGLLLLVGTGVVLLDTTPASAGCYTKYENRKYTENVCQYNGTQKWCYVATRYQLVPVRYCN